jgi:hypothetical protein
MGPGVTHAAHCRRDDPDWPMMIDHRWSLGIAGEARTQATAMPSVKAKE